MEEYVGKAYFDFLLYRIPANDHGYIIKFETPSIDFIKTNTRNEDVWLSL